MNGRTERSAWHVAVQAMSLGWELALPIFIGVLLGYGIDRKLGTKYGFTIGLMLLGVVAGFYNVLRSAARVEQAHRRGAGDEEAGWDESRR